MVIVEENEIKKEYKPHKMPKYKTRRGSINWLLMQRRNARILNVKSVSIQVKDIKMMIYSNRSLLVSLCSKISPLDDTEEYITIDKRDNLNKSLMYEILEVDWLIKANELDEMSIELVESKKNTDEFQLQVVKELKEKYPHLKLDNRIKLLQYKLDSLNEYLINRKKEKAKVKSK